MDVRAQTELLFHRHKRLLSDKMRNKIIQDDLSVIELADKMYTSHSQIYRILDGTSNVSLETLCRITAVLGLNNISELFK